MKKKSICIFIFTVILIFCLIISGTAQTKKELKIGFGQNVASLDPHYNTSIQDILASTLIYESLATYDRDRNIVPVLATSWKQIDDLTWEIKLREGVTFHSGNPFNAEAVKFSIERCSKTGPGGGYVGMVDHVEIVDDYTVNLYLKYEFGPIISHLSSGVVGILDPAFVKEKGEDIGQYASGTGAYQLKEYVPGSKVVYVKNDNYWGEPAKIETVEYVIIPEASTRVMALKTGEIDLVENPPPHELPSIEKDENLYVYISPKSRTLFMGFNMNDPNVGGKENQALREAINYAIDRDAIADYVLEGLGSAAHEGIMPTAVTGGLNDPTLVRKHDLEKAKQILKDAGVPPGKTIEFLVTRSRYLLDTEIGEVIQGQISKLGINVDLRPMEYASLAAILKEDKHQMYQVAWGCMTGEPTAPYFQLMSSTSMSNFSNWGDEETDKILDKALATVDWKERMIIYEQLYKKIFEDVAMIPIVLYQNIYAANKQLKNLYASPEELLDVKNFYFE